MTKKQNTLETNPTELEKIYYLQKDFNQITKFKLFNKIVKKFNANPNENYFNNIQSLLAEFIDFDVLNSTNAVTFYLIDSNGKMIISNINNVFSTYSDYTNNTTYFYNLSEEQGFLNYQFELETDKKIGVNLLETPILNTIVNGIDNPLGFLYYLIGQKNTCPEYNLVSFIYTLGNN
jgi:hypothetical protein